jgi:hypothetical protein
MHTNSPGDGEANYPPKQGDHYSLNKIMHESGFVLNGKEVIPPNDVHAKYFLTMYRFIMCSIKRY